MRRLIFGQFSIGLSWSSEEGKSGAGAPALQNLRFFGGASSARSVLERGAKFRFGPERAFFLAPAISGVYLWERGIFPSRVKLSIKSDYAARAVLWLAQHHQEGAARTVEEMASAQGIPPNYLVQILIELKSAQIVKSQRGKEGGYLLARPPAKITFGDVLRSIHGEIFDSPALNNPSNPPELRQAWQRLRRAVNQTADAITFQQLLDESLEKGKMYYI